MDRFETKARLPAITIFVNKVSAAIVEIGAVGSIVPNRRKAVE
jgi:hypothetical protein